MLYYHRIDISEGIDLAKVTTATANNFNHRFGFQDHVCNGCHDWVMECLNINDITIITVKNVD